MRTSSLVESVPLRPERLRRPVGGARRCRCGRAVPVDARAWLEARTVEVGRSSVRAAWGRCGARPTPGSIARSRSRSCRRPSPRIPSGLARFEREARLLAQLHHANIASIFGLEEGEGVPRPGHGARRRADARRAPERRPAVARREPVDRPADRRGARGRPRKGHRPPRPQAAEHQGRRSNGTVKVLDFGLAKAMAAPGSASSLEAGSAALMNSPTMTVRSGHATRRHPRHGGLHVARAGARRRRRQARPTSGRSAWCSSRCSPAAGSSPATRQATSSPPC